ncbi:MAG: pyridoxamine 5'-phosphate oxidase family protein [Smithellaceae bacterium]|nr:pyridoxamine 5'-phosphate oxidase family protein [Smithellaceae bacterium]
MKIYKEFEAADMLEFEPEAKVGLIATVSEEGLPHITLITALQAKSPTEMIWGQFSEGFSKKNVKTNPKTGFLIMSLKRDLWRGKAIWKHEEKEGPDYVMFNNKPMFRYNAYFGIHTVHYMDLVETYGKEGLPLLPIALSVIGTGIAAGSAKTGSRERILNPWSEGLFNRLDSVKFLAYVGEDGFPSIIPIIQCKAADSRRLAFGIAPYKEELLKIKAGTKVAVFGMTLQMEDILVRGTFGGFKRYGGIKMGTVDIDWVYNSMPPKQGQIYPVPEMVKPVMEFR